VRQILPEPASDVDATVYADDERPTPGDRPWLLVNMVSSTDGAISVGGRSGGLTTPGDQAVFHGLRAIADAILVGAGTVRAERYGPARPNDDVIRDRRERGQGDRPPIVIVSGRLDLDPDMRVFAESGSARPIVITAATANEERLRALQPVADVIATGDQHVDLVDGMAQLRQCGHAVVLCEGGPTLNGSLLAADLVDELCLTLSPLVAGGMAPRAVHGAPEVLQRMRLARAIVDDDALYLRYVRM
jgi:riboflavin-specific deaminase-like protein